jgi:hypothetical protein
MRYLNVPEMKAEKKVKLVVLLLAGKTAIGFLYFITATKTKRLFLKEPVRTAICFSF